MYAVGIKDTFVTTFSTSKWWVKQQMEIIAKCREAMTLENGGVMLSQAHVYMHTCVTLRFAKQPQWPLSR